MHLKECDYKLRSTVSFYLWGYNLEEEYEKGKYILLSSLFVYLIEYLEVYRIKQGENTERKKVKHV